MANDWKQFVNNLGYGLKEELTTTGTWIWADAGKPKILFIRLIGGAGGNAEDGVGSDGSAGGNTVWDSGGVVLTTTANGGTAATTTGRAGGVGNMPTANWGASWDGVSHKFLEQFGIPNCPSAGFSAAFYNGGYGWLRRIQYEPTGDVAYTIGAGGAEGNTNAGNGQQGAIELYY